MWSTWAGMCTWNKTKGNVRYDPYNNSNRKYIQRDIIIYLTLQLVIIYF
jgi:hypothetical protein